MVIKPSVVSYDEMSPDDMVVDVNSGQRVEGKWNSSSDTQPIWNYIVSTSQLRVLFILIQLML